ncbi:MAG TPA: hypothetical protein VF185_02305 [Patescibacteria group bacterium]
MSERRGLKVGMLGDYLDSVDTRGLRPKPVDLYISEFHLEKEDDTPVYIEISHFGNVTITAIYPTIIRMITGGKHEELDIFSIDDNGEVLAHTNRRYANGKEIVTKDNSLENLAPFEKKIMNQDHIEIIYQAKARLGRAFGHHSSELHK